ncbi:MAG: class I SAM-dependent methyltransferase [Candidatus Ancaeobacter aquaticus]|nr:class I SAM-dependent methyltransferase [Candidatus Ancaeobacter aquaticus]
MSEKHYNEEYFKDKDDLPVHIYATLDDVIEKNNYVSILEIGCGTGKLLSALHKNGRKVTGCDLSITAAKKADALVADVKELPYRSKSFDLLIGISLIEHLREEEAVLFLNEAKRLLKVRGALFLVTPNFSSPMRVVKGKKWFGYSDPTHVKFYSPESLAYKLEDNGFNQIKKTFKLDVYPDFDWGLHLKFPKVINCFISKLLISSPLALFRDSFWIMGNKM